MKLRHSAHPWGCNFSISDPYARPFLPPTWFALGAPRFITLHVALVVFLALLLVAILFFDSNIEGFSPAVNSLLTGDHAVVGSAGRHLRQGSQNYRHGQ